jgi:hypothetical protein
VVDVFYVHLLVHILPTTTPTYNPWIIGTRNSNASLSMNLVKFREHNVMVIQVGTCKMLVSKK